MKRSTGIGVGSVVAAIMAAAGSSASAAEVAAAAEGEAGTQPAGLEEIVVTAQKRAENLQDVPITISAISSQQLSDHDVRTLQDLSTITAGFAPPGDNGTSEPHLRGVGNAIISPGNDSGVSYYIDGVYMPTTLSTPISLADSQDIEILKGPQGTLFGRNSTAGVILITTRDPNPNKWEGQASVGYGNFSTESGDVFVGGPLTSQISTDVALTASHQGEGWGRNVNNGLEERKFPQAFTAHNKWIFNVSDATSVRLSFDWQRFVGDGTWDYAHFPNRALDIEGSPWNSDLATRMTAVNNLGGGSVKLTHEFDFATFTSITADRQATNTTFNLDSSATPELNEVFTYFQHARQYTQEMNLASKLPGPLQWTLGAYYFYGYDQGRGFVDIYGLLPGGEPFPVYLDAEQATRSISGYAQANYAITSSTKLTLGGRYTGETRDQRNNIGPQNPTSKIKADVPTWRAALTQQVTDAVNVYASASKGFKSGGFNLTAAESAAPFKPEFLTAYEIGSKAEFLDNRVRLNVSGFYYDYSGIQITTLVNALETVYNAAGAKIYGADADLKAVVGGGLTVSAGLEVLKSKYTNFENCTIYQPVAGGFATVQGSCDDNTLLQAPTLTFYLAPEYTIPTPYGTFLLAASYSHNSGYYASPDDTLHQPSFGLLSASLQLTTVDEKYYVRAWGKNLTNAVTTSVFGYGAGLGEPQQQNAMLNAPRTFGVTVGVRF
jgi:iron complex outermembrane receptor protein